MSIQSGARLTCPCTQYCQSLHWALAKDLTYLHTHSEDSGKIVQKSKLIWIYSQHARWKIQQKTFWFCFSFFPQETSSVIPCKLFSKETICRKVNTYFLGKIRKKYQGPVVQSIVSLTSSLMVKILTVLVSTIANSQVFLLKKKCE